MAYRSKEEQMQCFDAFPRKDTILPEFSDRRKMTPAFEKIRKEKRYHSPRGDQGIFAYPVFSDGRFIATLGCSIPHTEYTPENIRKINTVMSKAADEISSTLSTIDSIG